MNINGYKKTRHPDKRNVESNNSFPLSFTTIPSQTTKGVGRPFKIRSSSYSNPNKYLKNSSDSRNWDSSLIGPNDLNYNHQLATHLPVLYNEFSETKTARIAAKIDKSSFLMSRKNERESINSYENLYNEILSAKERINVKKDYTKGDEIIRPASSRVIKLDPIISKGIHLKKIIPKESTAHFTDPKDAFSPKKSENHPQDRQLNERIRDIRSSYTYFESIQETPKSEILIIPNTNTEIEKSAAMIKLKSSSQKEEEQATIIPKDIAFLSTTIKHIYNSCYQFKEGRDGVIILSSMSGTAFAEIIRFLYALYEAVHEHKVLTSFKLKLKSEPEIFDILGEIAEHALYLDLQFLVDICCTDISNNLTDINLIKHLPESIIISILTLSNIPNLFLIEHTILLLVDKEADSLDGFWNDTVRDIDMSSIWFTKYLKIVEHQGENENVDLPVFINQLKRHQKRYSSKHVDYYDIFSKMCIEFYIEQYYKSRKEQVYYQKQLNDVYNGLSRYRNGLTSIKLYTSSNLLIDTDLLSGILSMYTVHNKPITKSIHIVVDRIDDEWNYLPEILTFLNATSVHNIEVDLQIDEEYIINYPDLQEELEDDTMMEEISIKSNPFLGFVQWLAHSTKCNHTSKETTAVQECTESQKAHKKLKLVPMKNTKSKLCDINTMLDYLRLSSFQLTHLDLSNINLGVHGSKILATSLICSAQIKSTLRILNLSNVNCGVQGLSLLLQSIRNNIPNLNSLDISKNLECIYLIKSDPDLIEVSRNFADLLSSSENLESINLSRNHFSTIGLFKIVQGIKEIPGILREIDFSGVDGMGTVMVDNLLLTSLVKPKAKSIKSLNLNDCGLLPRMLEKLLVFLFDEMENIDDIGTIKKIDLGNNQLTPRFGCLIQAFSYKTPENRCLFSRITHLSLDNQANNNKIGDEGCYSLIMGINHHPALKYLNLSSQGVADLSMYGLNEILSGGSRLTQVILLRNEVTDEGVFLLKSEREHILTIVDLSKNLKISDSVKRKKREELEKSVLMEVESGVVILFS